MRGLVTLFGVAVITVFAFSAGAAAASESTQILPEPTAGEPLTTTVTQSAEGHLLSVAGLEVKCKKASGSETWTSVNSGSGSMLYTECKGPVSTVCTGEGDAEGTIAAKGEVHFWLASLMTGTKEKETTELIGALVFLLESAGAKFVCVNAKKTIEDKIVVHGCVASQVLPASLNALIREAKEEFAEWASGETKILKVLPPEAKEEINCLPTTSTNGGAEELAALTSLPVVASYRKGAPSEPAKILPEPTAGEPLTTTVTQSAEGHLLSVAGLEVKCKKASGSETWTSVNSGSGSMLYTECKGPVSTVCTGEGDAEGTIAAKGEVHFWLASLMTGTKEKETTELIGALVFLLESAGAKFVCVNAKKTIEDKIVVHGCVASQVLPASLNALIREAKEEFAEWASGETKILKSYRQKQKKRLTAYRQPQLMAAQKKGTAESTRARSRVRPRGSTRQLGAKPGASPLPTRRSLPAPAKYARSFTIARTRTRACGSGPWPGIAHTRAPSSTASWSGAGGSRTTSRSKTMGRVTEPGRVPSASTVAPIRREAYGDAAEHGGTPGSPAFTPLEASERDVAPSRSPRARWRRRCA